MLRLKDYYETGVDWDLLIEGNTVAAIQLFEAEFEKTGQPSHLFNMALGLLDLGQLERARDCFLKVIRLADVTVESHAVFLGTVQWMMGQTSQAVESWRRGQAAEFRDAAGGISSATALWYAATRLGDSELKSDAARILKRFWPVKDVRGRSRWPGEKAIAGYILGIVQAEDFLEKWTVENHTLESRRLCRAYFWVAVADRGLSNLEKSNYLRLASTRSRRAILEYEFFLSRWELSHI